MSSHEVTGPLRLSAEATYAMLALVQLARSPGRRATSSALAAANDLPLPFLLTIMGRLRAGGIVASTRGRLGGYVMVGDPEGVSLVDVVRCLGRDGSHPHVDRRNAAVEQLQATFESALVSSLANVTVASLLPRGAEDPAVG